MNNNDLQVLMNSTAEAVRHTLTIGGHNHGSSFWWNKLHRFFNSEKAATSVDIPAEVMLGGVVYEATCTFYRNGQYAIALNH